VLVSVKSLDLYLANVGSVSFVELVMGCNVSLSLFSSGNFVTEHGNSLIN